MLEEPTDQPVDRLPAVGREAHFLRQHVEARAVQEGGVGPDAGRVVGCEHVAEYVEGHAAGQLRGIAHHEHAAMRKGTDRGERRRARVVLDLEIAQRDVIGQAVWLLPVLPEAAEVNGRLRSRVGVRKDVVNIDARISVRLQLLEHDARRYGQRGIRLDQEREPRAATLAVIGGLLNPEGTRSVRTLRPDGRGRIDEPRQMMPVTHQAHRHRVAHRDIQRRAHVSPFLAVRDAFEGGVQHHFSLAELRLTRDVAHRAGF